MGDGLAIAGGGKTTVGTDHLFGTAQRLSVLGHEAETCLGSMASIDRYVETPALRAAGAPSAAFAAEQSLRDAAAVLMRALVGIGLLEGSLGIAAEADGFVDRATLRVGQELAARVAWAAGWALPGLLTLALPTVVGVAAAVMVGIALAPEAQRKAALARLPAALMTLEPVLSDPAFVTFVRFAIGSADDFEAGLAHLPPELSHLLGDEGLGVFGLVVATRVIVAIGQQGGELSETQVVTRPSGAERQGTVAEGWDDRASRIPEGQAQVRIDRYEVEGQQDRFEVYISGTRDFGLDADAQPFDMTSNLNGIGELSSGSERAVRQAMEQAGIQPDSPVLLTGHSQGGLVAARIAESGDYNVSGVYTLGAPASGVVVPASIPWIAVEHTDDLVPALSGHWASGDPVVVSRRAFDSPLPDTGFAFPAHRLDAYRETAMLIDGSSEARIAGAAAQFDTFAAPGSTVETRLYISERTAPIPSGVRP
ncbi:MAG: hypothetical protein JWO10_1834 [Microbacteriaceae bacterium]|nr:hypothetical protein [Microbacteriaceae bacterium]